MDILVVGLVFLFLAAVAVAFGIEWLGQWMSKQELRKEIATRTERPLGR